LESGRREREEEYKVSITEPHLKIRIRAVSDPNVDLQREGSGEKERQCRAS
jgi:hypothetical protein